MFRAALSLSLAAMVELVSSCAGAAQAVPAQDRGSRFTTARVLSRSTANTFEYEGARSCATSACHGGRAGGQMPVGSGVRGNEFIFWLDRDPHARASNSLHTDRGRQILDLLRI